MSNQQGKQYNLQIIDLEGRTSLLLKSILLGSDCRVSISSSISSARAKLETGLFDGAIVDLADNDRTNRIETMIEETVPTERTFPVGSITDRPEVRISPPELTIERPLRIHRFQKLIRRMKNRMSDGDRTKRQRLRSSISCKIRLDNQDRTLPVSCVSLNEKGLMARLEQRSREELLQDQVHGEDVSFLVRLPDRDVERELSADAAFTEQGTNDALTGIGLQFRSGSDEVRSTIETLKEHGAFQTEN